MFICGQLLCAAARCAEPAAPISVPDWAIAALSFRELGKGLDKAGAYVDRLLPNSAELAKEMAMSYLFSLPVDGALKKDGWAVIFELDPAGTGLSNERAFILCLADAAAMKTALTNTYGVPKEEAGILTFTLPQPVPQPDKTLAVKLAGDKLLAGPAPRFLPKLEDYLAFNPGGPFGKPALRTAAVPAAPAGETPALLPDVVLTLKVSSIKRSFGGMLQTSLEAGARAASRSPAEASNLSARINSLVDFVWQLDALEARLELDATGTRAALEVVALPARQSALAKAFAVPATPTSGDLLCLLPDKAACLASWNMNGTQLVDWLRAELEKQGQAGQPGAETVRPLLDLLQLVPGEAAFAASGSASAGGAFLLALRTSDQAKAAQSLTAFFKALGNLFALASAAGDVKVPLLKTLPDEEHSGVALHRLQVESPLAPPEGFAGVMGWPPGLQYALAGPTALVSAGKQGPEALKQAVSDARLLVPGAAPGGAGAAPGKTAALPGLAPGSFAVALLYPVRLVQLGLAAAPPGIAADAEKLTAGVPDVPLSLALRLSGDLAALRLDLPAAVPKAVYDLAMRLRRQTAGKGK